MTDQSQHYAILSFEESKSDKEWFYQNTNFTVLALNKILFDPEVEGESNQ
jgi:hypothetical protein